MKSHPSRARPTLLGAIIAIALGLGQSAAAQGFPPGPQGPAAVGVITAEVETVPYTVTLPGRAAAFQEASIRPTVEGIVEQINYRPGEPLKAGDLMFTLARDRYLAASAAAEAEQAGAEAAVAAAQTTVNRYRSLAGSGVTQVQLDTAEVELLTAKASLSSAQSAVTLARINLDGTEIRSPIEGIPSVSAVSVGAVVTANQTDALTTVRRLDPVYVDMTESSARMLRVRSRISSGQITPGQSLDATLTLEDGTLYDGKGTFVSPGTAVSATTGTIELRIEFANPDRLILPGQFLRVAVELGTTEAILVPQRATSRTSDGRLTAFIVRDGKSALVNLTESGSHRNSWIVTDGLTAGDKIIVDGLKSLRADMEVEPVAVVIGEDGLVEDAGSADAVPAGQPAPAKP
ncbi:efflux RND transporter periplasmic adaptor subunit [Hoeflea sp.]|uniref:efflux RND transporter periplasmic adaptor subunit n=1 Tax=Hoeflea sp. TaxID=1940281 RepID=UPI0019B4FE26|nr:efflux RND transporter periplasmic adaptor subunit [Hoeflea sp.]MBC7282045.1 efflux RND transporter periplasmic adaptor subunit [Hoeflea sp.]